MRELLETLAAWQAEGVDVGRAVVVRTFGSAPRPEGTVLLVTADGRLAGSISGGCVEAAACEEVASAVATRRSRVVRYGISEERAWEFRLACGGTIDVLVEPVVRPEVVAAATDASAGHGGGLAVVTPLPVEVPSGTADAHRPADGEPPGPVLPESGDGVLTGSLGDVGFDRHLVTASLDALRREDSRTVEIGLGPADAVAVISHDAKLDEPAIVTTLARGCWYVGAIGSRRTRVDRRAGLLAAGVPPEVLARLRGPIGLDLGGRAPAEIALAILAEIVAARHGGTGIPMVDRPPGG